MKVTKSGDIKVSLVTSSTANGVTLQIIDTGPGIDPKFASKLFQPFSKADSFNPGAGLGLYITKALVERMSGSISLHSTPGAQGATFEVILPVPLVTPIDKNGAEPKMVHHDIDMVAAEKYHGRSERQATIEPGSQDTASNPPQKAKVASPAAIAPAPELEQPPIPVSESLRVLVVDDNDISRKILMALLRKMSKSIGIETAQATDGVEAVAAFEPFRPHLILTDVSMPNMDGIAASTEMRRIEREKQLQRSKIFAITGLGSSDPRLKAAALRDDILDGWIVKGKDGLTGIRQIVEDANTHRATIASNASRDMETSESIENNEFPTKSALAESSFNNAMEGLWPEAGPAQNSSEAAAAASSDVSEDRSSTARRRSSDRDTISDSTSNSGRKRPLSMVESP
jgi:CheY-like chemotaxis protein